MPNDDIPGDNSWRWSRPLDPTPGWKLDPADGRRNRYWDGEAWGDESLSPYQVMQRDREGESQARGDTGGPDRSGMSDTNKFRLLVGGLLAVIIIGLVVTVSSLSGGEEAAVTDGAPITTKTADPPYDSSPVRQKGPVEQLAETCYGLDPIEIEIAIGQMLGDITITGRPIRRRASQLLLEGEAGCRELRRAMRQFMTEDEESPAGAPMPKPKKRSMAQEATKLLKDYGMWDQYSIRKVESSGGNLSVFTDLYPKDSNNRAATAICSTLIGTEPPEVNVSGFILVASVTGETFDVDECDSWYWDEIYGR